MFRSLLNSFFKRRIYLDYASLTPIDSIVVREMQKYSTSNYANPSSFYREGVSAKQALNSGRKEFAGFLGSHPDSVVFTSGGTEANNMAIIGAVESLRGKGVDYENMHVVVSAIEHSSVRECVNYLNNKGVVIDTVSVDKNGVVLLDELKRKLRRNTVLVSIMTVNNEIGSVQPIREIAKLIRHFREHNNSTSGSTNSDFDFQDYKYPIFHTDASQAALYEDLNVEKLGVDLLTLDGSKVYGPRGIGTLYIKKETPLIPIIYGGGQEQGRRSGTENIPAIMGLVKALATAKACREKETIRIKELRNYFIDQLKKIRSDVLINGSLQSPHIINVNIPKIDNEFFIMQMDAKGICCSTKSSCLRDEDESYVLKSIGGDSKRSIRFSFGRWTKKNDIDQTIKVISAVTGEMN